MKFAIWTPLHEAAPHAGVRALWRLGSELAARGHDVVMWMPGQAQPDCDVLVLPERTAPRVSHLRTVRWVLLHGGDRNPSDRVYTWSPTYTTAPLLRVPLFDLEVLCDPGLPRHGTAVWVGKGTQQGPLPADARLITYDLPRAVVLEILQTSTRLLSFDAHSSVNTEATLCGTPVTLPMARPATFPEGDDLGFQWADVDHRAPLDEVRARMVSHNAATAASIDSFERDMLAWT